MQDSPVNRLSSHWPDAAAPRTAPVPDTRSLGEKAKSWEQYVEEFMGDHPKLTVAAAAAIGLMVGWMVKRK